MSRPPSRFYKPMANSLAARVLAYFDANPDEVLSNMDVATKFDMHSNSVKGCLADAVKAGYLVRTPAASDGTRTRSLYSRNPRRDQMLQLSNALNSVKVEAQAGGGARLVDLAGCVRISRSNLAPVGRMLLNLAEAQP